MRKRDELRAYQHRVINHLYENPECFAILKLGAGKTASVLTTITDLIDDGAINHALVVAPKRVASITWPDEIKAWEHLRHLKYTVIEGTPRQRQEQLTWSARENRLTIIGIDNLQWLVDIVEDWDQKLRFFDALVIDETSKLKNPTSKRAKSLLKVSQRFRNRWGMTGTPRPNSLLDLFTPAKIITAGRLWGNSYYKWQKTHFYTTDFHGYNWQPIPGQDDKILREIATVSITLGENEMPDLPELTVLEEHVELPPDARQHYKEMEHKLFTEMADADVLAISQAVATGKLAQMANGFVYNDDGPQGGLGVHELHSEKETWLSELLEALQGEPVLVVYEYREDLAMIRRICGKDVPYLGAGVGDKAAQDHVAAWNRGELPVLAMHPASAGHGLNLQHGGSRMAWIAPTWSAELWDQAIARLHRPGQAAHVMVHVCVAAGTVDQLKLMRVHGKLTQQQAFASYLANARVVQPA